MHASSELMTILGETGKESLKNLALVTILTLVILLMRL